MEVVRAPADGVWRVGRSPDPLALNPPLDRDQLLNPKTGNRFDSPLANYQVLYFATTLEGCYGETLARFRPDVNLLKVVADEWTEQGFMPVGEVPKDWRTRRTAVRVNFANDSVFPNGIEFLDVDSIETRETLRTELADILAHYGHHDMDAAVVNGNDRRVTRWIGQWAFELTDGEGSPLLSGIRYSSRLSPYWECWAVFGDVSINEIERQPVASNDPALLSVAKAYGLHVH